MTTKRPHARGAEHRSVGRPSLPDDERGEPWSHRYPATLRTRVELAAAEDGVDPSVWIRDACERKLKSRKRAAKERG